jgi:hypothetical protein
MAMACFLRSHFWLANASVLPYFVYLLVRPEKFVMASGHLRGSVIVFEDEDHNLSGWWTVNGLHPIFHFHVFILENSSHVCRVLSGLFLSTYLCLSSIFLRQFTISIRVEVNGGGRGGGGV